MGIKYFNIEFDRDIYYAGQTVSGRVLLSVDKPKNLKAVELKLRGKAKCHWTSNESYTDSEGKTHYRDVNHNGKEIYFKNDIKLAGGKGDTYMLPIGDHVYPFSLILPTTVPPTYKGTYGEISFYGKAKLDIPWAIDKTQKKYFAVENPVILNKMPELMEPFEEERSKTFCCLCCASGPLTVVIHIPRTGYLYNETIPITLEVDNTSNVRARSVEIKLNQWITWRASDESKYEKKTLKTHTLGAVDKNSSETWNEHFQLGPDRYPNSGNSYVIQIKYELEIEVEAGGLHTDLELKTSITICDIRDEQENFSQPNQSGFVTPSLGPGFAPAPSIPIGLVCPSGYPVASYPPSSYPSGGAPYAAAAPTPILETSCEGNSQPSVYPIASFVPCPYPAEYRHSVEVPVSSAPENLSPYPAEAPMPSAPENLSPYPAEYRQPAEAPVPSAPENSSLFEVKPIEMPKSDFLNR